jgi:hypothetical protein
MHDYQGCGGPSAGCRHCRRILSETPEEGARRLTAENAARGLRAASDGAWELRTNIRFMEDDAMNDDNDTTADRRGRLLRGYGSVQLDAPPDPWAAGIARLRAMQGITLDTVAADDPRMEAIARGRADFYALVRTARRAAQQPAVGDVYTNPPDPWAPGIERMKEGR